MVNFRRVDPQIKTRIEGSSERTLPHFTITGVLSAEKNERADKKHIVSCTSAAALLLQS